MTRVFLRRSTHARAFTNRDRAVASSITEYDVDLAGIKKGKGVPFLLFGEDEDGDTLLTADPDAMLSWSSDRGPVTVHTVTLEE